MAAPLLLLVGKWYLHTGPIVVPVARLGCYSLGLLRRSDTVAVAALPLAAGSSSSSKWQLPQY